MTRETLIKNHFTQRIAELTSQVNGKKFGFCDVLLIRSLKIMSSSRAGKEICSLVDRKVTVSCNFSVGSIY